MNDLIKKGSQFIISTHSPILLSYPKSTIYEIRDKGLERVDYEDTDTFAITKQYLNNYQSMLKILLED